MTTGTKGRRRHRAWTTALVAVVIAVTTAACGGTLSGHASPGMTPVDLTELDFGLAPSEPTEFELDAMMLTTEIYDIEGRRMLAYLASPYEIDPELRYLGDTTVITQGSLAFGNFFPDSFEPIAERNHLVAGAATARENKSERRKKTGTVAVLRFGNETSARTASNEFDAELNVLYPGRQKTDVPGHPGVLAGVGPNHDRGQAIAVKGPYVIAVSVTTPADQFGDMAVRLQQLLDRQFEAMKDLTPTPADDILDLPINPDGIMNLTLPEKYSGGFGLYDELLGAYPPDAHQHFEYDAESVGDYSSYGVDLVARNGAVVYRTGSVAQAFALQSALARPGKYDEEIPGPPGIADSRCIQRDYSFGFIEGFYCVTVFENYVTMVDTSGAGDLPSPELYKSTAAQYAILANSR